jgi:hypothetical protein
MISENTLVIIKKRAADSPDLNCHGESWLLGNRSLAVGKCR